MPSVFSHIAGVKTALKLIRQIGAACHVAVWRRIGSVENKEKVGTRDVGAALPTD